MNAAGWCLFDAICTPPEYYPPPRRASSCVKMASRRAQRQYLNKT